MGQTIRRSVKLPPEQEAIRAKCLHPTGKFVEFPEEEVEQCIPERFKTIAGRYPERIAIRGKNETMTYKELDRTSDQLANSILSCGAKRSATVVLLLENDTPIIIAMLSALKVGFPYVPLDPSFPVSQLIFMLADSEAKIIVTNDANFALAKKLAASAQIVLNVDNISDQASKAPLARPISPSQLASIMYTSGSTGEPKGVMQTHRNVMHKVMCQTNSFHISPEDRLALLYSASFSASIRCIFCALLNGASIAIYDFKVHGPEPLADWLRAQEITIYFSVATVFRSVLDKLDKSRSFPSLRLIYLGSESVTRRDVNLFNAHCSNHSILVNSLATTETGQLLEYFIGHGNQFAGDVVPVGYPTTGKEILLLGEDGTELADGETGDMVVRSDYLSPGYWRKPELTQSKFRPAPNGSSRRCYYTGDLAARNPDGCFTHLGRKDFRAKVRGLWVDPARIEHALMAEECIKAACVVVNETDGREKTIVAYLVPATFPPPAVNGLRQILAAKFPAHTIPSKFVFLDRLPLTATGKVDRRALPEFGHTRPQLDTPFAPPSSPIENEIAQIWADVLSLDRVGVHDNLFDLGGDSLLATRLCSRVIGRFPLKLLPESLFRASTIAEMATVIVQQHGQAPGDPQLQKILAELESLSDDDAQRLLADRAVAKQNRN